jgi:ubiquinone/menaquinone biosynthesis C-methylase UbiE
MNHHHHVHDHDKGFMANLHWLRQIRKFWQSDTNRAVTDLVNVQAGETVLDIGAGMGPATVVAARQGATVIAVDPSPLMRNILSVRRLCQKARSRITVANGVAENLPADDGSINAAWTVNAIHHWVDLEAAFDELARVLAPGGRVVLLDEDFTHPDHPLYTTHSGHEDELTNVHVEEIAAALTARGIEATGELTTMAGVPVKLIQGVKAA